MVATAAGFRTICERLQDELKKAVAKYGETSRQCAAERARFEEETERLSIQVSEAIAASQEELRLELGQGNRRILELEGTQVPVDRPATSSRVSPRGRPPLDVQPFSIGSLESSEKQFFTGLQAAVVVAPQGTMPPGLQTRITPC